MICCPVKENRSPLHFPGATCMRKISEEIDLAPPSPLKETKYFFSRKPAIRKYIYIKVRIKTKTLLIKHGKVVLFLSHGIWVICYYIHLILFYPSNLSHNIIDIDVVVYCTIYHINQL